MKKKADYQKMLLKMIRPLTRHYTDDGSGLYLGAFSAGYGNRIAEMEGFSMVLWGLASYWAGGGEDESLLSVYQKGLARLLPTEEIFTIRISGWWKWRLSAMAFYWCRKSCGSR